MKLWFAASSPCQQADWKARSGPTNESTFRTLKGTFARDRAGPIAGLSRLAKVCPSVPNLKVKYGFCGRCSAFVRSSTDFVAGATLKVLKGQAQISWQAQRFRKVRYRLRGRRRTLARPSSESAAPATKSAPDPLRAAPATKCVLDLTKAPRLPQNPYFTSQNPYLTLRQCCACHEICA